MVTPDTCFLVHLHKTIQTITKKMFTSVLKRTFGIKTDCVFTIDPTSLHLKEELKKHITRENIEEITKEINGDLPF